MNRFLLSVVLSVVVSSSVFGIQYQLSEFMQEKSSAGFGYVNIDDKSYFKTTINPNFSLKGLQLGLGVNLYLSLGDYGYPKSADFLTLRYIGYDYQKKHGFKYGRLNNLTLGQGLLVDGFDTGSGGTNEFNNKKTGALAYVTVLKTKVTALQTAQDVQGVRIERPIVQLASAPLSIGATYMTDNDGINDSTSGTLVTRPKQDGYAADVFWPIGGDFFTLFTEYSELIDQGKGVSSGARGTFFNIVDYRAEYRALGKGFVPGYFNQTYQSTGFNFTTDALSDKTSGILVNAASDIMGDYAKAGLQYERYEDVNVLTAALGWKQIGPVTGVINYSKPFSTADDRAIVIGDFYYRTNYIFDLIFRVKRVSSNSSEFTESVSVSTVFKIERLFPKLPI